MKTATFSTSFNAMIPPQHSHWDMDWIKRNNDLDEQEDQDEDEEYLEEERSSLSDLSDKIGTVLKGEVTTYNLVDLVGVGTFAAVYLANDTQGHVYAVKTLFKKGLTEEQVDIQRMEAELHGSLTNVPNVVKLHETLEDDECLYLVLEYCTDDLYNVLQKPGTNLDDQTVKHLFKQVTGAVLGMHQKGIYHRDLKPENLLLGEDGEVRVADFGLATKETWCEDLACGTRSYLAPETMNEDLDGYHPGAADVWALGVILVNLRFRCKL